MDFSLTETQAILQDSALRLARNDYDFETRRKRLDGGERDDGTFWKQMAELGLLGIGIEETPNAAAQRQGRWKHGDMMARYARGEAAGEVLKWLT